MRLEGQRGLDDVGGADHPAHSPAGHRVGLGHAVEDDGLVGQLGHQLDDVRALSVLVQQVLVDLIRDDPDAVLECPLADRRQLGGGVDAARRVRRRAHEQHLRALGACGLQLLDAHLVVLVRARENLDGGRAGELDDLGVGGPVRGRQDRLVAGAQQGGERLEHGLLAAVGDDDVCGGDLVAGVAQGLGGDGFTQRGQAGGGRVAVHRGVARGLHGGLDNVVGRGEVGLAGTEADHRATGGLEGLGLRVHGQGRGRGDGVETIRDTGARSIGHPSMVPRRACVRRGAHAMCAWSTSHSRGRGWYFAALDSLAGFSVGQKAALSTNVRQAGFPA